MTTKEVRKLDAARDAAWDQASAHGRTCRRCGRWAYGTWNDLTRACETGLALSGRYQEADEAVCDVPDAAKVAAGL